MPSHSPELPHLSKTPRDSKIPFFKGPRSANKGLRRLRQINLPGKVHDLRAENSVLPVRRHFNHTVILPYGKKPKRLQELGKHPKNPSVGL